MPAGPAALRASHAETSPPVSLSYAKDGIAVDRVQTCPPIRRGRPPFAAP